MGLDMWLTEKTYVKNEDSSKAKDRFEIEIKKGGKDVGSIQTSRIIYIEEELLYLRNAHHIHGWFVKNVQDGIDNCESWSVSKEHLLRLLHVCTEVNNLLSKSKLITSLQGPGEPVTMYTVDNEIQIMEKWGSTYPFSFFNKELYSNYLDQLKVTIKCIRELKDKKGDYYYRATW